MQFPSHDLCWPWHQPQPPATLWNPVQRMAATVVRQSQADDNADFYVISFTWEWHKMSTYTLFLSNRRNQYLQHNRIFNPCLCLFKWKLSRLHRGILIFRETVTIPQFSHLSKSFIKTSWNQQVWAENPRHQALFLLIWQITTAPTNQGRC